MGELLAKDGVAARKTVALSRDRGKFRVKRVEFRGRCAANGASPSSKAKKHGPRDSLLLVCAPIDEAREKKESRSLAQIRTRRTHGLRDGDCDHLGKRGGHSRAR